MLPNGYNDISVEEEHHHLIPKDKALNWVPIRIMGIFTHGVLNDYAFIKTKKSSYASMMVQGGALHGACIIYGIQYLLEEVS